MASKKHYIAIAEIFARRINSKTVEPWELAEFSEIAEELATILKTDNPLFDRQRFLNACGVPQ